MSKTDKQEQKNSYYNSPWFYLPLILVSTFVMGILGQVLLKDYLSDGNYFSYYNEVDLGQLTAANQGLVIRDPKKVVVNQDVKIAETIANLKPSLLSVFKKIKISDQNTNDFSQYYDLNNPLIFGFIITSDGWAVASVDSGFNFSASDLVVIDNNRKLYEISSLSKVNSDGLIFFRLADAHNLPVRKNLAKSDFFLGQSLLAFKSLNAIAPLNLTSLKEKKNVLSSENYNLALGLSLPSETIKNSLVFDLAGNLAVIINAKGELIPAFTYNYQWQGLLGNLSARPLLGVNYLDLSTIKLAGKEVDIYKGALLFSNSVLPAVVKDSPAEVAGLQENDIITWVNNYEINADNDLAEIISLYKPNDVLRLTYLRDGVEFRADLTLGSLALENIASSTAVIK